MNEPNDTFNYLAVLFSIILGLAVTEILQGFRRLLLQRRRVVIYWPAVLWGLTLLLVLAQFWWAMFGLRAEASWTFGKYGIVLLQAALLYLTAGLAMSGLDEESGLDMKRAYFDHARPFFILMLLAAASSLLRDVLITGHLPEPANLGFHLVFALTALIAALTRNAWYHRLNAPLVAGMFTTYVVILFDRMA